MGNGHMGIPVEMFSFINSANFLIVNVKYVKERKIYYFWLSVNLSLVNNFTEDQHQSRFLRIVNNKCMAEMVYMLYYF